MKKIYIVLFVFTLMAVQGIYQSALAQNPSLEIYPWDADGLTPPCLSKINTYGLLERNNDPEGLNLISEHVVYCQWTISPSQAGKFYYDPTSNHLIPAMIIWDENYTGIVTLTANVLTDITTAGNISQQYVTSIEINTSLAYSPPRLSKNEMYACINFTIDLDDDNVIGKSKKNNCYWSGPGIRDGAVFDPSGLQAGNSYDVYFWEYGKEGVDPCNNELNKLTIHLRDEIVVPEDMLVLNANSTEPIPLSHFYEWSGTGVEPISHRYQFNPSGLAEGRYVLSFTERYSCRKGKKVIFVKAEKTLPQNDKSFVQITTVLRKGIVNPSEIDSLHVDDGAVAVEKIYYDAVGRPSQTIQKQASPSGKDIVSFNVYDPLGRTPLKYMPFTDSTDGGWKDNVLEKQKKFYNNTAGIAHSNFAYGKVDLENSVFGRVVSVYAPGESWVGADNKSGVKQKANTGGYVRMLRAGFGAAPKTISSEEMAGIESELLLAVYDADQNDVKAKTGVEISQGFEIGEGGELALTIMELGDRTTSEMFSLNQFYPENELVITEFTDMKGIKSRKYSNKSGQTVMSESQSDSQGTTFLQTYQVYDDFGRLRYVFPPMAVEQLRENGWRINNDILKLATYYEYDKKNRVTISKVPDKGAIYTVYDILDRPVLSQDALQRAKSPQEWSFVKYDLYGRLVLSGVYKSNLGREALQQKADQSLQNASPYFEVKTNESAFPHYSNQAFPTLFPSDEVESASYYDHYDFNEDGVADAVYDTLYDNRLPYRPIVDLRNFGRQTGSFTRLDLPSGETKWLETYVFYDDKGRVVQGRSGNHLGGVDIALIRYDSLGRVPFTFLRHQTIQGNITRNVHVKERYVYDHMGRPLRYYQTIQKDSEAALAEEKLSEVGYNEIGQVIEKKLGNDNLQTLDFTYNIQGWLTKYNKLENFDNDPDKDLFAYNLFYENPDNPDSTAKPTNLYSMEWKTASDKVKRGYRYGYDALDRLKNATYTGGTGMEQYSENNLSYDANGNILTLDRFGLASVGNYGKTDRLTYNYDGNRLLSVTDSVNTTGIAGDFQDKNKTGNDYEYDLNGNLTRDRNKEIASIKYNPMDLPVMILWENGNKIEYLYDRTGNKLKSRAYQKTTGGADSLVRETDYVGGFIYEGNELSYMSTAEGRYLFKIKDAPSGGKTQGYEYYLTDHQGNLRMSFRKGDTLTYTAGMEIENSNQENREFDNVANVRSSPGQGRTGSYSAKIDQSVPMGIWKTLKVSKGDKVDAEVWARYTQDNTQNNGSGLGVYATTQVPSIATNPDKPSGNSAPLLVLGISYAPNQNQNPNNSNVVPRAYLIGILYDTKGNLVETHRVEVTSDAKNNWKELTQSITVSQTGQLQIFVANEGDVPVFFDDMEITLSQHLISQENHYSPFGVNLVGIEKTGTNRFLYNAMTEKNSDFDLDWYETPFRSYDAQIGRFHQVDKLAGMYPGITPYHFALNNPVMANDPTGLYSLFNSRTGGYDNLSDYLSTSGFEMVAGEGGGAGGGGSPGNVLNFILSNWGQIGDGSKFSFQNGQCVGYTIQPPMPPKTSGGTEGVAEEGSAGDTSSGGTNGDAVRQGRGLLIRGTNESVYSEFGNLVREDGSTYNGNDAFILAIGTAINEIRTNSTFGRDFLLELESTQSHTFIIEASTNGRSTTIGNRTRMALNSGQSVLTEGGLEELPLYITLVHELAHSYANTRADNLNFAFTDWATINTREGPATLSSSEIYASHIENIVRSDAGLNLRTYYSNDTFGKAIESTQLINGRRSIFFENSFDFRNNFNPTSLLIQSNNAYVYPRNRR